MDYWQAFILAVIEGVTEYLPISSTGHLIIASYFMGINENAYVKSFNVIIQSGAILAVLVLYWRRLRAPLSFYLKIAAGFMPAAVIGLLVKDHIDIILGSVQVVVAALFFGGLILLWVDRKKFGEKKNIESLGYAQAFFIGLCQCLAFIPGVSRSGASIVGGLFFGLSRKDAAEFSFFLAVPTLAGATVVKGREVFQNLEDGQAGVLIFGIFVSFVVAMLAIKSFIQLINRRGFTDFGIYRIVLALILLVIALR